MWFHHFIPYNMMKLETWRLGVGYELWIGLLCCGLTMLNTQESGEITASPCDLFQISIYPRIT